MSFNIFKVFQVFGIVSAWSAKALEDGKISLSEAVELAVSLAGLLGIPTDINLATAGAPPLPEAENTGTELNTEENARAPQTTRG